MTAPRICLFTETYHPVVGGGETQAKALAEGLVANGFDVIVLTRRSDASFKKVERLGQVAVYRVPPVGREHLKKWGLMLTGFVALVRLRRQYDVLFVSGFRVIGVPAVVVSRLFGKSCFLKADSPGEMSGDFFAPGMARIGLNANSALFRLFIAIRNRILRLVTGFVAISTEIVNELTAHGVAPSKIAFIPNGVDMEVFHPVSSHTKEALRKRLALPLDATFVTYTGRLVSYKGLPFLLKVWKRLRQERNGIRLLLIGAGSLDIHNCEQELRDFVEDNDLHDSVLFAGEVRNVSQYLQASDVFVFLTEREAFGIALIEAMACGLPVISTSVGGVKDILEHRSNGLVVQPGDFQQLLRALHTLITDSFLSSRLGEAAWRTVQNRYSTEVVTREYVELLRTQDYVEPT